MTSAFARKQAEAVTVPCENCCCWEWRKIAASRGGNLVTEKCLRCGSTRTYLEPYRVERKPGPRRQWPQKVVLSAEEARRKRAA